MEQYQFELWEECNSKCTFCYLGKNNTKTEDSKKIQNIDNALNTLRDDSIYKEIDTVGFIGGEFFQGQLNNPQVKNKFMTLMSYCSELLQQGKLKNVWICATLTIGDQKDLYECLELFKDKSKLWILTSYDTLGRFHTKNMELNWYSHVKKLISLGVKVNITSITTGDFIEKYIQQRMPLLEQAKQLGAVQFLKPPCNIQTGEKTWLDKSEVNKLIPNFFPKRQKFLEFLMIYKQREPEFMYYKLFNIQFRSSYLFKYQYGNAGSHRLKNRWQEQLSDGTNDVCSCGHSQQYRCYIDTDDCCICDKEMIQQL